MPGPPQKPAAQFNLDDYFDPAELTPQQSQPDTAGPHPYLAALVRGIGGVGSGILASEPGLGSALGAGASALSEKLAQKINKEDDPASILTAAGLGAIPMGRVFKALKTGESIAAPLAKNAIRGAAVAQLGQSVNRAAHGQSAMPNSGDILGDVIGAAPAIPMVMGAQRIAQNTASGRAAQDAMAAAQKEMEQEAEAFAGGWRRPTTEAGAQSTILGKEGYATPQQKMRYGVPETQYKFNAEKTPPPTGDITMDTPTSSKTTDTLMEGPIRTGGFSAGQSTGTGTFPVSIPVEAEEPAVATAPINKAIPRTDPETVSNSTYSTADQAKNAIMATGRRGIPVRLGKGKWGVLLEKSSDEAGAPAGSIPEPVESDPLKTTFVRHGDTDLNGTGGNSTEVIRGWNNVPLNEMGQQHADQAGQAIARVHAIEPYQAIYTSDLDRAMETAGRINAATGNQLPVIVKSELRPWNLGELTGRPVSEVQPEIQTYIDNPDIPVPGGESFNQYLGRYLPVAKEIHEAPGHNIIVGHTRTAAAFDGLAQNEGKMPIPTDIFKTKHPLKPGGVMFIGNDWDTKFGATPDKSVDAAAAGIPKLTLEQRLQNSIQGVPPQEGAPQAPPQLTAGQEPTAPQLAAQAPTRFAQELGVSKPAVPANRPANATAAAAKAIAAETTPKAPEPIPVAPQGVTTPPPPTPPVAAPTPPQTPSTPAPLGTVSAPLPNDVIKQLMTTKEPMDTAAIAYGNMKDAVKAGTATPDQLREAGKAYGVAQSAHLANLKQLAAAGADIPPEMLGPNNPRTPPQGPKRPVGRPKNVAPTAVAQPQAPAGTTVDLSNAKTAKDVQAAVVKTLQDLANSPDAKSLPEVTWQPSKAYGGKEGTILVNGNPEVNVDRYGSMKWSYGSQLKPEVNGDSPSYQQAAFDVRKESPYGATLNKNNTATEQGKEAIQRMNDYLVRQIPNLQQMQVNVPGGPTLSINGTKNSLLNAAERVASGDPADWQGIVDQVKRTPIKVDTNYGTNFNAKTGDAPGYKLPGAAANGPFGKNPQGGAMDPQLAMQLSKHIAGAALGGLLGNQVGSDDDAKRRDAWIGAVAGGIAPTFMGKGGLDKAAKFRALGLVGAPITTGVKALGDTGAVLNEALIGSIAKQDPAYGKRILGEFFSKKTVDNLINAYKNPSVSLPQAASYTGVPFSQKGPLSWGPRALGALTEATQGALQRAGLSEEAAKDITYLGKNPNETAEAIANIPHTGPLGRLLMPMARVGTNLFTKGVVDSSPLGLTKLMGENAPAINSEAGRRIIAQSALGTGLGTATYLTGGPSTQEQSDHPTRAAWEKRLLEAAAGPSAIPVAAGMMANQYANSPKSPSGMKVLNDTAQAVAQRMPLPTANVADTIRSLVVPKLLGDYAKFHDESGLPEPLGHGDSVSARKINNDVLDPIAADIPFLREQLPERSTIPNLTPLEIRQLEAYIRSIQPK